MHDDQADGRGPGRLRYRPRPAAAAGTVTGFAAGRDEPLGLGSSEHRDGVLYVPDTAESGAPVLLFLHGATGTGLAHRRAVLAAADRYGVVLAAPDSRHAGTWDLIAEGRLGPDPAFLDQVVEYLTDHADLDIDTGRIALGGVSDGASYALTLGLTNGDVFAALIAFSPGFLATPELIGTPRLYISHGTEDKVLPIDTCSRSIVSQLRDLHYDVTYREFDGGHTVPPPIADDALAWWLEAG